MSYQVQVPGYEYLQVSGGEGRGGTSEPGMSTRVGITLAYLMHGPRSFAPISC